MVLNPNQFNLETVQGQIDLQFGGSVITAQVASTQVVDLVAGQAVKLADVGGGVPKVVSLAANTDASFGIVLRNVKDIDYPAYAPVEIAMAGSVVYMTAGAAIARGAKVEFVNASTKVITAAGVNPVLGFAYDKATADGDLIRVYILNPQVNATTIADVAGLQTILDTAVKTINVTATLAEINAGKTLIPAVAGKAIKVTGYTARVTGNFAATTSVDIQSSNGTPVKAAVLAVAALTTGAVLVPGAANTTLGAGYSVPLGTGDGLVVANIGSTATGGTSIVFTINYTQA